MSKLCSEIEKQKVEFLLETLNQHSLLDINYKKYKIVFDRIYFPLEAVANKSWKYFDEAILSDYMPYKKELGYCIDDKSISFSISRIKNFLRTQFKYSINVDIKNKLQKIFPDFFLPSLKQLSLNRIADLLEYEDAEMKYQSSSIKDTELGDEIVSICPKAKLILKNNSPVFKPLDELYNENKLTDKTATHPYHQFAIMPFSIGKMR